MTWQQIAAEVNRKLVDAASPPVTPAGMLGLLNEAYDGLLTQWWQMTFERDEVAIQLLAPLKRGPFSPTPGIVFDLDPAVFTGGVRYITLMRGKFLQSCSQVEEWRAIEFLPDNDISDLENPLRRPTNDIPKYRIWWNGSAGFKKVTIECDAAPTDIKVFIIPQIAPLTALSGSPLIDTAGHYDIVRRAVDLQSGTNEDVRKPVFGSESNRDMQTKLN